MDQQQFVRDLTNRMSLEQKVGQCIVFGMAGTRITNDIREAVVRFHCGGIRLSPFDRYFAYIHDKQCIPQTRNNRAPLIKMTRPGLPPAVSLSHFAAMLNELRRLAAERTPALPLHMVVDQEGDVSKDFAMGGVIQFPSNLGLAASGDPETAYRVARAIGAQMRGLGLNMIHSPVVDINTAPDNPEIGHRAFGDTPEQVTAFAAAMLRGFQQERIIAAAKHFPGRGSSSVDAHDSCPHCRTDRRHLLQFDCEPYRELIARGIDAIMIAHGIYDSVDPRAIATVSRDVVTGLLREELGFEGVITTDSMTMGALVKAFGTGEACARALAAGADCVLMKAEDGRRAETFFTICDWVAAGRISEDELDAKVRRLLLMKYRYGLFDSMGMVDPARAEEATRAPEIADAADDAARSALLVCRDELGALPVDPAKKILIITQLVTIKTPNDAWDHPALLSQLLEEELPGAQCIETAFGRDASDERRVLAMCDTGDYDLILCTNFYDRIAAPLHYPHMLIERGLPVALITNTPYTLKGAGGVVAGAPTLIVNMNVTPPGFRALRELLFGRLTPAGRWPLQTYDLPVRPAKSWQESN
jgi:beta-N-acetylhexosaminidase